MILNIGLPRTGTASMAEALKILGYKKVVHKVSELKIISIEEIKKLDALTDFAGLIQAKAFTLDQIKKEFDAQFILTTRPFGSWYESCTNFFKRKHNPNNPGPDKYVSPIHDTVFKGITDEDAYKKMYTDHNVRAKLLFPGLLELNVEEVSWKKLCNFLKKSVPEEDYPHVNRG